MQRLRMEILRAVTLVIACSLFTASSIMSTALFVQRVQAQPGIDIAVVSITPVVYYPTVYVWKGQMRVGNGSSLPAMLVYSVNVSRNDYAGGLPVVYVAVALVRVNLTNSPAETISYVNTTYIALVPSQNVSVTFTWYEDGNASSLAASRAGVAWMIGCNASLVSVSPDIDPSNNLLWDGNTVAYTGLVGDINGDGFVDVYDAILLSNAFNTYPGHPNWNPNADMNSDNFIDIYDAILLANNLNQLMP